MGVRQYQRDYASSKMCQVYALVLRSCRRDAGWLLQLQIADGEFVRNEQAVAAESVVSSHGP